MKYLHVIASLDPQLGGPAEGIRQLTRAAQRLGHEVEIATIDPPGAAWNRDYPCEVHGLGPGRLGRYSHAPALRGWLRQNASRFSAVIVNGLWQYPGFATWQALRGTDTPYFVFTHGMLDPWFKRQYPLKHLKKWLYWSWAEYRVLRDACAVLFTCEEERRLAHESFSLYQANEAVVSYGTPGPDGDPEQQRTAFLQRFPELHGQRLLLFLGRIHEKKGCDLLIEAFAAVTHHEPRLHLVIAGPDQAELKATLVARARKLGIDRITWTGMLSGDLKWGAFHSAEAFVLPSHQENFGIAVAEAIACGVPALISDKVNIWREIVGDGAGIVANDTLAGTRTLLESWLELDATARERMAQNALDSFKRRYHIDAAAQTLVATMRDCMANRARGSRDAGPRTMSGLPGK